MAQESNTVLYQVDGVLARITLNRPEKRNALNEALVSNLKSNLRQANGDSAVRVIVLSGAGQDFCSGADLSALQKISEASVAENLADARSLMELFMLMRQLSVPIVAAVRGKALAGGCGLASACDLYSLQPMLALLSRSEDWVRPGDGDGDSAKERFRETRVLN
jgi:methylglutaconyl-CoA hydratase